MGGCLVDIKLKVQQTYFTIKEWEHFKPNMFNLDYNTVLPNLCVTILLFYDILNIIPDYRTQNIWTNVAIKQTLEIAKFRSMSSIHQRFYSPLSSTMYVSTTLIIGLLRLALDDRCRVTSINLTRNIQRTRVDKYL